MASTIPKEFKKATTDIWAAEPWYVALFLNTSNCLTQSLYSACTNEVANGNGYTTGGKVLTLSSAYDSTNAVLDAVDVAWPASTFANVLYAVVYRPSTSAIKAIYEFDAAKTVTSGTFTIEWNASGLIKIS